MQIKRFGVSLENEILEKLDKLVSSKKFPNRSQAIRFLINNHIVDNEWQKNQEVAGAIVMVYDHHKKDLQTKSLGIQHDYHDLILAVQHVHLNHDNCLETIAVKGKSQKLLDLADRLKGIKGMKHLRFVMSSAGE
jgi:CopG family transcriptional regulator, nickel-responsive regulator